MYWHGVASGQGRDELTLCRKKLQAAAQHSSLARQQIVNGEERRVEGGIR